MSSLRDHPSVRRYFDRKGSLTPAAPAAPLDSAWVRQVVLDAGADDVGLASIDNPVLAPYRQKLLKVFPETRTCISVICRMNPENVRSPLRQQYELEYHHMYREVNHVGRRAAARFAQDGVRALDCTSSYPMNMENFPNLGISGAMWYVQHKPIAVAAGKGVMGVHHLVVHERFGPMMALSSILIDREVTEYGKPLDYDPCCKCMLCVTSCPVGAINADGHINAMSCYTHSYRDKYGGFVDWIENIVQSRSVAEYRRKHSDAETVLMWQTLSLGTSYKCSNCMAVCPGGDDNIGRYAEDQDRYREEVARRLVEQEGTVYVVRGSDAEAHVLKRFPHKKIKYVNRCSRPTSAASFLDNLPLIFEREQSKGLSAVYHFSFTGAETCQGTVVIRDRKIEVSAGLTGTPDMQVTADSKAWVEILRGEKNIFVAMLTRKVRVRGPKALLKAFVRCFPG